MASYTPNLNLIKPADADSYDVANDNGNMDKIDAAYSTLNSKVLPQLFFGDGKGKYYGMTSKASIDAAVNDTVNPTNDNNGFFSIDNAYSITNFGNRQFLFGWLNTGKTYGWVIICSFGNVAIGTRNGSASFTIRMI